MRNPSSDEVIKEIVQLLSSAGPVSRAVPIRSAFTDWVVSVSELADRDAAAERAWQILTEAVSQKEPISSHRRPMVAAFHLLALGTYGADAEIVEDTTRTLEDLRLKAKPPIMATDPHGVLGLRQSIAAEAGGYGKDRSSLNASKPRLHEIATAVFLKVQELAQTAYPKATGEEHSGSSSKLEGKAAATPSVEAPMSSDVAPESAETLIVHARPAVRPGRRWSWIVSVTLTGAGLALAALLPATIRAPYAGPTATPGSPTTTVHSTDALSQLAGWGPSRTTFTNARPATYAVINSITDNPAQGDERNFVQVRHLSDSNATYTDLIAAKPGDLLVVYVYVANDAADDFLQDPAILQGLSVQLSQYQTGRNIGLQIILNATNAKSVWDGVNVLAPQPAHLEYVPNSLEAHSFGKSDGSHAFDSQAFGKGKPVLIGLDGSDGRLPVGRNTDGKELGVMYLTFRMKVQAE